VTDVNKRRCRAILPVALVAPVALALDLTASRVAEGPHASAAHSKTSAAMVAGTEIQLRIGATSDRTVTSYGGIDEPDL
jgi:hypothetical protein